ncbi:M23 family metallopeptidase [Litoreibacter ponti]|nr:M23 family metallopeptidase [Litoreibacter ponti]
MISAFASPVLAEAPSFQLPIDCELGETCFIQNYVDTDPSAAHRDFTCGPLSYDGHKGTDVRLISLADMEAGVAVLAAAAGTVTATRDGMADIASTAPNAPDLEGRDCGNGLVIDHGDGWETQYCHMKNGSLSVSNGEKVAAGATLGEVGLSGRTEFPHIHMSIRRAGKVVDPFAPEPRAACGPSDDSLWADTPEYVGGGLMQAGFASDIPEFDAIKAGLASPPTLPADAGALVMWGFAFGTQEGDRMRFRIDGPMGWSHEQEVEFDKSQAQLFRASGRRKPPEGWASGSYKGRITLMRGDAVLGEEVLSVTIAR